MFRRFRRSAFRLETRPQYALTVERPAFERFLAGAPLPPSALSWWREWLDEVGVLTRQGKRIGRVRVLSDPPTRYQEWGLWGTAWHIRAGEDIRYLPRRTADVLGIPMGDWWLFDDQQLVAMTFTPQGDIAGKMLITGPAVSDCCAWRDLAVRHAITAEAIAAA